MGHASPHACRIEQGRYRGRDEPRQFVDPDSRAGAGAIEDQTEPPGRQAGRQAGRQGSLASTFLGLGREEGRQVRLALVRHPARRMAPALELDLYGQISAAP